MLIMQRKVGTGSGLDLIGPIEDSDPATVITSGWNMVTSVATSGALGQQGGFSGTSHRSKVGGTGSESITWTIPNLKTQSYDVYTHWSEYPTRATGVEYTINHNGGSTTHVVSQQGNATINNWVLLGTHAFTAGSTTVVLTDANTNNSFIIGDAIVFVKAGDPAPTFPFVYS